MPNSEPNEFYTPLQVADRYNNAITVRTLANWRSIGQGPDYIKIGGKVMYPANAVAKWELTRHIKLTE